MVTIIPLLKYIPRENLDCPQGIRRRSVYSQALHLVRRYPATPAGSPPNEKPPAIAGSPRVSFACVPVVSLGNQLARWSNRFFHAADLLFSNSVP